MCLSKRNFNFFCQKRPTSLFLTCNLVDPLCERGSIVATLYQLLYKNETLSVEHNEDLLSETISRDPPAAPAGWLD